MYLTLDTRQHEVNNLLSIKKCDLDFIEKFCKFVLHIREEPLDQGFLPIFLLGNPEKFRDGSLKKP